MTNQEHVYNHQQDTPIDYPAKTIVSLVPAITESLFDLELDGRLIGRTNQCVYPVGKVETVEAIGDVDAPDIERIVALEPELVIVNYEVNRRTDIERLQDSDIPIWITFPKTVQDVFNLLWNIMYLFDQTEMAPRVRLIERTYDWINGMALQNEEYAPKVFVPIRHTPLITFTSDTYLHNVIRVCGGQNVFGDYVVDELNSIDDIVMPPFGEITRYPQVTLEQVEIQQPDIILLPSEPYGFTEEHIDAFKQLDVPASKEGRIHLVDGRNLSWGGTRVAYALQDIPELINPIG